MESSSVEVGEIDGVPVDFARKQERLMPRIYPAKFTVAAFSELLRNVSQRA